MIKNMERVRMTDAEVANNFAAVLEKLRHGAEVVVEQDHRPVAVISPVKGPGRPIDECIALAKAHGSGARLDEEYAKDLEEIIASRSTRRHGTNSRLQRGYRGGTEYTYDWPYARKTASASLTL